MSTENPNPQESQINLDSPEIQEAIKAQVEQATQGLKAKNSELIGKVKDYSDKLKTFDGIDPEKTRSVLAKLDQDEDARLVAEGKLDEVVEKRVMNMKKDFDTKYTDLTEQLEQERAQVGAFKSKAISAEIVKAGTSVGVLNTALNDVILRSQGQFSIDDKGNVVAVDGDGNVVYDADGTTPLSVENWVNTLKKDAPHLFQKATHSQIATHQGAGHPATKLGDSEKERQAYFAQKFNLPMK